MSPSKGRERKKVLFLESGSGFGGSSMCLYRFLKYGDLGEVIPEVLYHRYGPNIKLIQQLGIRTQEYSLFSMIRAFIACDLVYINNDIYSHRVAIILAKLFAKPCVCHMRGARPLTRSEKLFIPSIEKFVAVSLFCKQNLIREGVPENKIEVIFDGVSIDRPVPAAAPGRHVTIGVVSRLIPGKGLDIFIEAAKLVGQNYEKAEFVIYGDDPQPGKPTMVFLKQLAAASGLNGKMDFAGWKDNPMEIYCTLDIVVCPSGLPEALGNNVIEGMIAGRPVIASATGAYPEMIQEGVSGLLFKPGDANELYRKLGMLIENENLRFQLGKEAQRVALEKFSIANNVVKIVNLIHKN